MKKECVNCGKVKCKLHPKYEAKRQPRCSCETCWEIWEKRQNEK